MTSPQWAATLDALITSDDDELGAMIGITPLRYSHGRFEAAWRPGQRWAMPHSDGLFGGSAASALEAAMGWATMTALDDDEVPVAVRMEQDFVRPARAGRHYDVVAWVAAHRGTLWFVRAEITDADAEVVALGSGVIRAVRPRR